MGSTDCFIGSDINIELKLETTGMDDQNAEEVAETLLTRICLWLQLLKK